jgi:adenylate cyclase
MQIDQSNKLKAALGLPLVPRGGGRMRDSVRAAELDGLTFAFWARLLGIGIVTLWLVFLVPWPRDAYYATYGLGFFILGFVPYRLRHHRHASAIKLAFVVADVALVTTAILMPPPAGLSGDWPVQARLRGQEYLYLLLLLAEAALTYSPFTVLWTGAVIAAIWSLGVQVIYSLPGTTTFAQLSSEVAASSEAALRVYFDPTFVGLTAWRTQLIATGLLTVILTIAVWRSRRTLLAHVEAEIVRSDLARYVSPDLVDALVLQAPEGLGEPAVRTVAVLYADIVGFTGFAERLPPERSFALLRSFRERSCRVVFKNGGTLDKYLGDGFMATFGGIQVQENVAERALTCAFELQEEIGRWNAKRRARGAVPIEVSVGAHCGPVVVGNLGSQTCSEFTVVGDVVNVASRLEAATREFRAAIVVSGTCVTAAGSHWRERFQEEANLKPRGREQGLKIHLVLRHRPADRRSEPAANESLSVLKRAPGYAEGSGLERAAATPAAHHDIG